MSKASRMRRYRDNEYIRINTLSGEVISHYGTSPMRPGNDMGKPRSQRGNMTRLVLAFWEQERNTLVVRSPLRKSGKKCILLSIWNTIKFAGQLLYLYLQLGSYVGVVQAMDVGGDDEG